MKHAKPMPQVTERLERKFYERIIRLENGCWGWSGYLNNKGYAVIDVVTLQNHRETMLAHRLSCLMHYGPPPEGKPDALHSCDCKPCTNPDHLRWGSNGDNRLDWVARGDLSKMRTSVPKGSANGQSKLTEKQVLEIRRLLSAGVFQKHIVEEFGIDQAVISRIKHRHIWRHI